MTNPLPLLRLVRRGTRTPAERGRLHLENGLARLNDLQQFANAVLDGPARGIRNPELRRAMEIVLLHAGAVHGDLAAAWHEHELAHMEEDE